METAATKKRYKILEDSTNYGSINTSSFFNLSKPFLLNLINETPTTASNSNRSKFTFLEPFESHHLTNGGGKLKSSQNNTKSSQPYSLIKPIQNNNNDKNDCSNTSSSSSSLSTSSSNNSTQQNNSNAILSRLSTISNSFKSIFVRPKNTKHVDLDSFNKRTTTNTKTTSGQKSEDGTKFKINFQYQMKLRVWTIII